MRKIRYTGMKSAIIKTFIFVILGQFVGCKPDEPRYQYKYNDKPVYSWGYAEFYGSFYNYAEIPQNVVTLSLFSDSLFVNDEGSLAGHGQYLFIEDIFISANDTLLPSGVYKADTTAAPMTFYPGELFAVMIINFHREHTCIISRKEQHSPLSNT